MPPQSNPELPTPPQSSPIQNLPPMMSQPAQQSYDKSWNIIGITGRYATLATLSFVGLVLFLIGFAFFKLSQIPANYIHTEGKIVSIANNYSTSGSTTYAPVIQFESKDGMMHEFRDSTSSSSRPTIGGTANVAYNPNNPESNPKNTSSSKLGTLIGKIIMAVSGVVFVVNILLFIKSKAST